MVLFGTHPVVVKPVDDRLNADVKLACKLFNGQLIRIRVTKVSCFQRLLLLLTKKQPWLLLISRLVSGGPVATRLPSTSCK